MLLVLAALLALAALTPLTASMDGEIATVPSIVAENAAPSDDGRDTDLALYDSIIAHVANDENYYAVAIEEQRAATTPYPPVWPSGWRRWHFSMPVWVRMSHRV